MDEKANQSLDRMTRSAVSRVFQCGRPWRAPRHRSAWRSALLAHLKLNSNKRNTSNITQHQPQYEHTKLSTYITSPRPLPPFQHRGRCILRSSPSHLASWLSLALLFCSRAAFAFPCWRLGDSIHREVLHRSYISLRSLHTQPFRLRPLHFAAGWTCIPHA